MKIQGVPFLTITEYVRAKLNSWIMCVRHLFISTLRTLKRYSRRLDLDAHDLLYVLARYWNSVDANRISDTDMNVFVHENPDAAPPWAAIRRKYDL